MRQLVIAAFWTDKDAEEILQVVGDVVESVALPKSGGVALMADPPDPELRQMLVSLEGLEDAARRPVGKLL